MNAGATRAACVPRRVRTPQAPTSARAPLVFAYPAMARTVKVCVWVCACMGVSVFNHVYVSVQAAVCF